MTIFEVVVVVGGNVVAVVSGRSVVVPIVVMSLFIVVATVGRVVGTLVVIEEVTGEVGLAVVEEVIIGTSIRFSAGVPVMYVASLGVTTTSLVASGSGVEVRVLRSANNLLIVRCCNVCSSDSCSSTFRGSTDVLTCAGREVVVLLLVLRGVVDLVTLNTDLVGVG